MTITSPSVIDARASRPAETGQHDRQGNLSRWRGVDGADLDSVCVCEFGIPRETEAPGLNVAPGTSAYEAGLRAGDIILEINHEKCATRATPSN